MASRPNFTPNPTEQTPNPAATENPAICSPSASPPASASLPSPIHASNRPFKVFISHAGEDKVTIAIPLRHKLLQRGITAFVDKKDMPPGTEASQAMMHAMATASIAVLVLSPEFVARKWPMKEMMHFLTRFDECKAAGVQTPTIIPLFYRLNISELYDEPRLDRIDGNGNELYRMSRFYERQRNGEPEASIAGIKAALKRMHNFMGVVNAVKARNDTGYEMSLVREMLLDTLCNKICQTVPVSTVQSSVTEHVREPECDTFRPHFDVEHDVSDLVFDLDRKDDDGIACTQEGKILHMLLDEAMDRNRAISVRGMGGVGKTSLLRKIRSLDRVFERFKDGVYYVEVGKDVTRGGLKDVLISLVLKSGGKQTAENLRRETDMRKVMEAFRSWFSEKQCLFVIDDVWNTAEITRGTIRDLQNLHTSGRDSKTLLTTRSIDIATYGMAYVSLKPRDPLEAESRAILYHYAGLKPEQGQDEDNRSVKEILERSAGLPLLLSVAGKGVKTLSIRSGHKGCMAYRFYADQLKTSMGEMITTETESYEGLSARLKISVDLVEERMKGFDFKVSCSMAEMHRRLSVMKKQMRVPIRMLKHLWGVEHDTEAARIAKEFEQVGLADMEFEEQKCKTVEALRLHDSVYEFAVYETKLWKEENVGHVTVLEGYGKGLGRVGGEREWWRKELEDDQYIHGNVCRHLREGGLEGELFGLLLSPEWLERQVEVSGVAFAEGDFSVGIEANERKTGRAGKTERDKMDEALQMIREAITLSLSYILKNGRELWFQVHGRLKGAEECNTLIREYLKRIEGNGPKPGVLCTKGLLVQAGGANTRIIPVGSGVDCMAMLNEGERVACGCWNGDIVIVNVCRSEIEVQWRAHDKWVSAIDVAKDGARIVSGGRVSGGGDLTKVWDVQSGACVATFAGHRSPLTIVSITHDGKRAVACAIHGEVQVWDIESGQRVGETFKNASMDCLTIFKDGEHVMMGGNYGRLEIWNVLANERVGPSFRGHTGRVKCATMTDDESRLVSLSSDFTARIWDVAGRQQVGDSFEGQTKLVRCVAMSDDERRVASGSDDAWIRLWDVENGEQVSDVLIGHTSSVNGVLFLEEMDTIVSCSSDGTVRVWDLKKKREETKVDKHSGAPTSVSFTLSGEFVVSGSQDGSLRIWDAISGETVGQPLLSGTCVRGLAVAPDGRFVVSISFDKLVRVWDLHTRALVGSFEGHTSRIMCVAVTTDHAVTGSSDDTLRVWDLKSMDGSHFVLEGHRTSVWRVFVTDDGKRIISVDAYDNIFVWDIETRKTILRTSNDEALEMSRRQMLDLIGQGTAHEEVGWSIALRGNEIVYGEGSVARVLGTLDSTAVSDWDVSPDKRTMCLGLPNGQARFLKLHL